MDNCYLTANDHERYLDNLARSKAMCADKLRHGYCLKEQCSSCEKKKLWDACEAELAPYSKLLLKDKTDVAIGNIAVAHPTLEEVRENSEMNRTARREALKEWWKDSWYESLFDGSLMALITVILVPIIIPIFGCMEWFL